MRASIVVGLAAGMIAGAASAQDVAGETLTLLCQGTQISQIPSVGYGYGYSAYREVRQPAQMVVVVEGGQVRMKPPELAVPVYAKRSSDGWYVLSDAVVDKFTIRGRAKFSRIDRERLDIDRRTGSATFGVFTGICNRVANDADATRF